MLRAEMDPGSKRLESLKELEKQTGLRVITYVCGDRPGGARAQIHEDVLPVLYSHLRTMISEDHKPKIGLYLYSRGGLVEAPWKIVTLIRQMSSSLTVMVPFKAHSAATMIAIGADRILMHEMGELGPIDPSLSLMADAGRPASSLSSEIGVEDISAFLRFLRDRAGLSDQGPMAQLMVKLTESLSPTVLGKVERAYSHSRLVAGKLLSQQHPPLDADKISRIIEALTEKCYMHSHAIRQPEAMELGLSAELAKGKTNSTMWDLYELYEEALKLTSDPTMQLPADGSPYEEPNLPIAFVESTSHCHAYVGKSVTRVIRRMPSQFTVSLNLSVPGELAKKSGLSQDDLNKMAQLLLPTIQQSVQTSLAAQAVQEARTTEFSGRWERLE